jgi:hypothetical protein
MNWIRKLFFPIAAIFLFSGITYAEISLVALTGQTAPGFDDVSFSSVSRASVNQSGVIAFHAALSNGVEGIFKLYHGQLFTVALSGQSVSGMPGVTFDSLGDPVINVYGSIAFIASLQGSEPGLQAVFVATPLSMQKVLDTATAGFSFIQDLQFNDRDDIVIYNRGNSEVAAGIYIVSNGASSLLIPGTVSSFSLNNRGDIVYIGSDGGIYLYSEGEAQLIVQSGQSVPNTSLTLDTLTSLSLNDLQEVVFINQVQSYFKGLYSTAVLKWKAGALEMIVQIGDPVPGTNHTFSYFSDPLIDNTGRVVFVSGFLSSQGGAIFSFYEGAFEILVQEGQALAGIGAFTFLSQPDINNSGAVTFLSNMDTGKTGIFQLNIVSAELLFPEVADGTSGDTSWRTTLILSNRDYGMSSVSVAFIQDDGLPMTVTIQGTPVGLVIQNQTGSLFRFNLPPLGRLQIETTGAGNLKTGWARVQSNKSIAGITIFSLYKSGNFINEVGAPATPALKSFSFLVETRANIHTAIAIANPNPSTAQASLVLRDSQGILLDSSVSLTIPGNGHVQKYLTELYPQSIVTTDLKGTLEVGSFVPIVGISFRQKEMDFTWLPLIPSAAQPVFVSPE